MTSRDLHGKAKAKAARISPGETVVVTGLASSSSLLGAIYRMGLRAHRKEIKPPAHARQYSITVTTQ